MKPVRQERDQVMSIASSRRYQSSVRAATRAVVSPAFRYAPGPHRGADMSVRSYLTASDLPMDQDAIKRSFAQHLEYSMGKDENSATTRDFFKSLALSARDRMFDRWNVTQQGYHFRDERRVYYLSLEYLLGRLLSDSLMNLGIHEQARAALEEP